MNEFEAEAAEALAGGCEIGVFLAREDGEAT